MALVASLDGACFLALAVRLLGLLMVACFVAASSKDSGLASWPALGASWLTCSLGSLSALSKDSGLASWSSLGGSWLTCSAISGEELLALELILALRASSSFLSLSFSRALS